MLLNAVLSLGTFKLFGGNFATAGGQPQPPKVKIPVEVEYDGYIEVDGQPMGYFEDPDAGSIRLADGRVFGRGGGSNTPKSIQWQFLDAKKTRQATTRGWSLSDIQSTLDNPVEVKSTIFKGSTNPSTVYYRSDGHYVVRDDVTGDVFHLSNTADPTWIDPFNDVVRPR